MSPCADSPEQAAVRHRTTIKTTLMIRAWGKNSAGFDRDGYPEFRVEILCSGYQFTTREKSFRHFFLQPKMVGRGEQAGIPSRIGDAAAERKR